MNFLNRMNDVHQLISKATIKDAKSMHKLINDFADKGRMLARPLSDVYENLRDYFVIRHHDKVVACAALHISWADLAEIKSLAVDKEYQNQGYGRAIIDACLKEAKELQIPRVFALTYEGQFFAACQFKEVDKKVLPHKVWGECYRCPKFPDCDEIAMVYDLAQET